MVWERTLYAQVMSLGSNIKHLKKKVNSKNLKNGQEVDPFQFILRVKNSCDIKTKWKIV